MFKVQMFLEKNLITSFIYDAQKMKEIQQLIIH